jgi:hypothetical protein
MSIDDLDWNELQNATLKDAWYELEGAYEVYSIGRCRFVLVHCRMAMLIGFALTARKKGFFLSEWEISALGQKLGMPEHLRDSCNAIDLAGRYRSFLGERSDDQEQAAYMLSRSLEVFEWMRGEMNG